MEFTESKISMHLKGNTTCSKGKTNITRSSLQPYIGNIVLYFLLTCMATAFSIASILSLGNFLQVLFGTSLAKNANPSLLESFLNDVYAYFLQFGKSNALIIFAGIIFGIYFLKDLFTYLASYFVASTRYKIIRNIRNRLFAAYTKADVAWFDRYRKGDLISRISQDVIEYDQNVLLGLQTFVSVVVNIVLYFGILLYLNTSLTLTTLVVVPVIGAGVSFVSRKLRGSSRKMQNQSAELISRLEETISGLRIIKSHTAIEFMCKRFSEFNTAYTRLRTKIYRRVDLASPQSEFFGNCMVIGILLLGTSYIIAPVPSMSAEMFIIYLIIFTQIIKPAKDFSTSLYNISKGRASEARIAEMLSEENDTRDEVSKECLNERIEKIELCALSFSYSDTPTLQDINLIFERGVPTAVVGPSGAGKSTLMDLLMKFYLPKSGEILLNGKSIEDLSGTEVRKHIAIVSQDTILFNDTIANNLTFGSETYSHEQITEAARAAKADEFIEALPEGYQTRLGDGGCTLSGGQRQRLAIARAVLRNPDVLILDEATASLDSISEKYIQQAVWELAKERIVITIAHRLSTIRNFPKIVVLSDGKVSAQGTHESLLEESELYLRLTKAQNLDKQNSL